MSPGIEDQVPDIADIHLALARIRQQVRLTPVINDPIMDEAIVAETVAVGSGVRPDGFDARI